MFECDRLVSAWRKMGKAVISRRAAACAVLSLRAGAIRNQINPRSHGIAFQLYCPLQAARQVADGNAYRSTRGSRCHHQILRQEVRVAIGRRLDIPRATIAAQQTIAARRNLERKSLIRPGHQSYRRISPVRINLLALQAEPELRQSRLRAISARRLINHKLYGKGGNWGVP